MSTVTQITGTRTSLTTSAMNSLASGTFVVAGTINHTTNDPIDVLLEVKVTPGTVASPKLVNVYAQGSLDGTNFESGPTSGSTTTDEGNLTFVGTIPCMSNSTAQTGIFSLAEAFGGVLPQQTKIIIKNDTGAALAASGHHVYYSEVTGSVA